jgi:hypothetical protein
MLKDRVEASPDQDRILLGLLESVERESKQTQRGLAQPLGWSMPI